MFPYAGPLLRLWPWLSTDLQKRLLGIHLRHGKLSVKKVIASLRGASPALARTVALIGQHSEVPDKSHSSAPALESAALKVPSSRTKFNCSPYVLHTCDVLLEKYVTTPSSDVKVSCEKFFLTLVDAGPSPLLLQWQKDGKDIDINEPRFSSKQTNGASTLHIRCVRKSDEGCYKCLVKYAFQKSGKPSSEAELRVCKFVVFVHTILLASYLLSNFLFSLQVLPLTSPKIQKTSH